MVQFLIVDDGSSLESKISPPPPRLSIEFVIVGGAIAGITAAVSLARAGHKVTLLDNDPNLFKVRTRRYCSPNININIHPCIIYKSPMGGGCRVAPDATRLFYQWGMEEALRAASIKSTGVLFARCTSRPFFRFRAP